MIPDDASLEHYSDSDDKPSMKRSHAKPRRRRNRASRVLLSESEQSGSTMDLDGGNAHRSTDSRRAHSSERNFGGFAQLSYGDKNRDNSSHGGSTSEDE